MPPSEVAERESLEEIDAGFADRLSAAMQRAGLNQGSLATAVGKSQSAVSRWLNEGRVPSILTLKRIAEATRESVDALLGIPVRDSRRPAPARADDHHLPKVAFTAAGAPVHDVIRKDDTIWYAFHRSWISRKAGRTAAEDEERLVVVQVDRKHLGESMVPTVKPGALLVVDRGPRGQGIASPSELKPNRLYLVNIDGGLTVKRVLHTGEKDGMLMLASDNPDRNAYPPRVVRLGRTPLQKVVIGRVIWIGHEEE